MKRTLIIAMFVALGSLFGGANVAEAQPSGRPACSDMPDLKCGWNCKGSAGSRTCSKGGEYCVEKTLKDGSKAWFCRTTNDPVQPRQDEGNRAPRPGEASRG